MRLASRWFFITAVLAAWPMTAFGVNSSLSLGQHVIRSWNGDSGLPQGSVSALAQTPDGYVWAGTQEGFVRFDGAEFVRFDKASTPEMRQNMVMAMIASRDGSLYAATNGGGIVHVDRRRVRTLGVADGLPSESVTALHESGDGTLWAGTQKGLVHRRRDGRFVAPVATSLLPHHSVTAIAEDWSGQVWIGTTAGLVTLKDGRVTRHDDDGFPGAHIVTLHLSRDGSMWIGTQGAGLFRYRAGKMRVYSAADGLLSASISSVFEDRDGTIWIGTYDQGVARLRGERFDFSTEPLGIGNKAVSSFLQDRDGHLWIGSTHGLTRVSEGKVVAFTSAQGLLTDRVRTVHTDRDGTVWVGSTRGIQTFDGRRLGKDAGLSSDLVLSAWTARDGSMWVGTFDRGLHHVRDGVTKVYDTTNGLRSNIVVSVYEDRGGVVWVGTSRGLQRIVNGEVTRETIALAGEAVGILYEDRSGAMWAGTQDGGLNRVLDGRVTSFTTKNGLGSDFILSLHQDATGAMWVGTFGGGLHRYKEGRWTSITTREGLFDDSVFAILEDDNGFLWMSCNKGIFRVARQQLDDFAEGLQKKVQSISYGRADGMASRECNGGNQPAAWKARDGKLWFATTKGVVMVDPARARASAAPPVIIDSITYDRKRIDSPDEPIPAGTKGVEFHYAGINFVAPEKVRYQYKLEGFDADWVDAGASRVATYTNLKPGKYRFQVRAANEDGPWNTTTTAIRQQAFFYQTPWFLAGAVFLVGGGITMAHRARVRLIRASAERFKLLFDRSPVAEYRATISGGVLDCNDACAKMFGFASRTELMTNGLNDLFWSDAEWQALLVRLREQGALSGCETQLRRIDGTAIWTLVNAALVDDKVGQPVVEATLVDITERRNAEEEVRYRAHHDVLTGLPNRALFRDRLSVALNYAHRQGNLLAVMCLDLDRFSVVNDAFGRAAGDDVLQAVAQRLSACVRAEDSVARVGDDEFMLVMMKPSDFNDVTIVARKILESIAQPLKINEQEFNITISIGIAFYPQDGGDAETLLKNASSALYRAKEAGRNTFQLSSPFLARKAADRLVMENALHEALDHKEFLLHYQPQLDLRTQTITAMEALIRWDRRGKSLMRPAEFIGVAEDSRLILPIGAWAIEEACRQGRVWHSEGVGMRMAVNVSARQFQQPNIVTMIEDALDRSGFDPHYLEIEITESTAMYDPNLTADILLELKNHGITIAIDDFGVGHSSLNYLKRFPIDALKIDRTFVQDIARGGSDGAIVSAVIAMAKALDIRVIAEGVETDEQLEFLREHGCHEVQGYLFCRPMAPATLTDMIQTHSPGAYTHNYARAIPPIPFREN